MAVMVTFTLKADSQTYQSMHGQLLPVAISGGLLFHSAHEVGSEVGIAPPDDVEVTPVLNAESR
jgi:hypothetical protein